MIARVGLERRQRLVLPAPFHQWTETRPSVLSTGAWRKLSNRNGLRVGFSRRVIGPLRARTHSRFLLLLLPRSPLPEQV